MRPVSYFSFSDLAANIAGKQSGARKDQYVDVVGEAKTVKSQGRYISGLRIGRFSLLNSARFLELIFLRIKLYLPPLTMKDILTIAMIVAASVIQAQPQPKLEFTSGKDTTAIVMYVDTGFICGCLLYYFDLKRWGKNLRKEKQDILREAMD